MTFLSLCATDRLPQELTFSRLSSFFGFQRELLLYSSGSLQFTPVVFARTHCISQQPTEILSVRSAFVPAVSAVGQERSWCGRRTTTDHRRHSREHGRAQRRLDHATCAVLCSSDDGCRRWPRRVLFRAPEWAQSAPLTVALYESNEIVVWISGLPDPRCLIRGYCQASLTSARNEKWH